MTAGIYPPTAPQRANSTHTPRPESNAQQQIAAHLDMLYGNAQGYAVLGHIDGDPRFEKMRSQWYHWPRQRQGMIDDAARLAQTVGNIYARLTLFQTRKGATMSNALPSRVLWCDDVQREQAQHFTHLIETSPSNYQGYVVLDTPQPTSERAVFMGALRTAAHGDACSIDVIHYVRLPGGANTKAHGWHVVRVAKASTAPLALTTFTHTHAPAIAAARTAEQTRPVAAPAIGRVHDGSQGAMLFHSSRWQALITARPQLRQLIILGERIPVRMPDGSLDDSDSAQLAVFVQNCRTAKRPPPASEIIAVACYLQPQLQPDETLDNYRVDIEQRLLIKYPVPVGRVVEATRLLTQNVPATYSTPARSTPTHKPGKVQPQASIGRPAGHAERMRARVLAELEGIEPDAFGRRVYFNSQLAERLKVSTRSITTHITALAHAGKLTRGQQGGRGGLPYVVISRVANKSPEPAQNSPDQHYSRVESNSTVQGIEVPQITPVGSQCIGSTYPTTCGPDLRPPALGSNGGGCVLPSNPQPAPSLVEAPRTVSLRTAIAETYAAYASVRMTGKRLRAYITANYPALVDRLDWEGGAVFARMRAVVVREREWARKLASIAGLSNAGLRSQLRLADAMLDRASEQEEEAARFWRAYASALQAEMQRRPAPPRAGPPRRSTENKLTPREAGRLMQRRLLDELAPQLFAPAPVRVARAAHERPVLPDADAAGLIARLKARQAVTA